MICGKRPVLLLLLPLCVLMTLVVVDFLGTPQHSRFKIVNSMKTVPLTNQLDHTGNHSDDKTTPGDQLDLDDTVKNKNELNLSSINVHPQVTSFNFEETMLEVEKGVIYRPINKSATKEKYPAPRLTNYEPYLPFNKTLFFPNSASRQEQLTPKKIILWYTEPGYYLPMKKLQPLRFCPDFPCLVTTNRAYAKQSAMLIFNGQKGRTDRPPARESADQVFLFHNQESWSQEGFRRTRYNNPAWRSVFNWTMSYRGDATIPAYYGVVRKHPNPPNKDYKQILSKKKRLVAWMVSHCKAPSQRDKYVAELKKYIDVDVYGGCGTKKCHRSKDDQCSTKITESYKFYLSFENAFCRDYLSEKFYRFMPLDLVTVARGSNEHNKHAPPGTYINTADFETPRHLADRLKFLDKNDDEYIKILKQKDQFIYLFEDFPHRDSKGHITYMHYHYESIPMCQACQKLWNLESNRNKVADIQEWLGKQDCRKATDI